MPEASETIRLGLALAMLFGASVSDLRTRRVPNYYWFPFAAFALVFVLGDLARYPSTELALPYILAALLSALWYGLWYFGMFGGADAKGLIVFSWLVPWPLREDVPLPPVLDATVNGTVMVLVYPVLFFVSNLLRGRVVFPAMLLGVPMDLSQAQARKVWPMQNVVDGRLQWTYWHRIGAGLEEVYLALRKAGVQEVWTTPKVPFLVPIALGLVLAIAYGNVLDWILRWGAP